MTTQNLHGIYSLLAIVWHFTHINPWNPRSTLWDQSHSIPSSIGFLHLVFNSYSISSGIDACWDPEDIGPEMESCKKCIRVSSWDQPPRKERKGADWQGEDVGCALRLSWWPFTIVPSCGRTAGLLRPWWTSQWMWAVPGKANPTKAIPKEGWGGPRWKLTKSSTKSHWILTL